MHNSKDLRCGKVLDKLPVMLERMTVMLVRFLDTVQVAHIGFLDQGEFEQWSEPTTRGARRLAGIDLNNARNRSVVDAVVGLATEPEGFSLRQLTDSIRSRTGWSAERYTTRQAAYDLAKLRGKNLVQRRAHSRRYEANPDGVRTMCGYLVLREHVIKPLLAGVAHPRAPSPCPIDPLDQHYVCLRDELLNTFSTLGLARCQ